MTGNEIWVWQEREPNGNWGIVTAFIQVLQAHGPLMARSEKGAESFRGMAQQHALKTGRAVRLCHFTKTDIKEEIDHAE